MPALLRLPARGGGRVDVRMTDGLAPERGRDWNRIAYAAAHVVADPLADADPWLDVAVDWEATLAYREHLWSLGFGVAEAMDTAQRFQVGWPTARELIRRCGALRLDTGFVAGASTDQSPGAASRSALVDAVVEQVAVRVAVFHIDAAFADEAIDIVETLIVAGIDR